MAGLWLVWLVCHWFVGGLDSLLLVSGQFGWFVGGLDGLWVVSSFKANAVLYSNYMP